LTGLVNRRALRKWIKLEVDKANENNTNLSILLFDLDKFKQINDNYGHLTGDIVLRTFAHILKQELVDDHLIGRYGGEEFLAIIPNSDIDKARETAERIRLSCHRVVVTGHEGQTTQFTTSIGIAQYNHNEALDELIHRVDQGLYTAKESGRDMVVEAASN